jgi:hypothetical protein
MLHLLAIPYTNPGKQKSIILREELKPNTIKHEDLDFKIKETDFLLFSFP